jgi:epoxide hydrolase-like predicted phosphatase
MAGVASGFGPRPAMATAIRRIREANLRTAALTNNWPRADDAESEFPPTGDGLGFDVVIESAVVGLRKPDPRIYELVLSKLGVDAPDAVFLDDLGINLKPARAMGMTTIKVTDSDVALAELSRVLGFEVH